jgi:hypothetical protein
MSIFDISSYSIGVAVLIGGIRFQKINALYYPFIICMAIGFLNEIFCGLMEGTQYNFNFNNNIYVLVESLLLLWQFKNWGSFTNRNPLFWGIGFIFLASWLVENFVIRDISQVASYFRVIYSFVLVLLAINQVNEIVIRDRKNILINPIFLISIGIICFYTFKVLVELFLTYGPSGAEEFKTNVFLIHEWINLFSNLVYAFAILWMQKRQRFLLPS